jgi:heterodisulfide reductase subunit A
VVSDEGVVVSKTTMFACSDAAQEEMIEDIKTRQLDGLVVASCSPKLHLFTFRAVAERAGLNPYQYVQVNLREQDSWVHQHDKKRATDKGIRLTRAGIAKCSLTSPLSTTRIRTNPSVLVIGAGMAGMRAALALSDMNLAVHLIERSDRVGGWTGRWKKLFPNDKPSAEIVRDLYEQIQQRDNIALLLEAELLKKSGTVGDFTVTVQVQEAETITLNVGAIIVATGFDTYAPRDGEFAYGTQGVVTLMEFKDMIDKSNHSLTYSGRPVKTVVYLYCVGSRQQEGESPNRYCSRYCCSAAVHTALGVQEKFADVNQYHLYRDMRTYGKYELLYEETSKNGSIFIKFDGDAPPVVTRPDGGPSVVVKDQLIGGEEIEINPDLVVLVTGMVPRENSRLTDVLKLPVGRDGFYNEIHPKLRPVETVINGVFITGASQGPKTLAESVASGLAAVSKTAGLLLKGYVELEPLVAKVNPDSCLWCEECSKACPYGAVEKTAVEGREVARIIPALCSGGGACVPACPRDAIDLEGYTDAQVRATIDSLAREVV